MIAYGLEFKACCMFNCDIPPIECMFGLSCVKPGALTYIISIIQIYISY